MPETVAVIPTRNENVFELRQLINQIEPLVVVVDDSDEGWPIWGSGGRLIIGSGDLGGSIILGLREARASGAKSVVVLDAGGSHDPREIPHLMGVRADLIIGSRFCAGGRHEGPWWRSVGSRVAAAAFNLRYGTHIKDWTSGYRVYSDKAVAAILEAGPRCERHAVQAEILAICIEAGLSVREVPITYSVGSGSTFNRKAVAEIVRLWWSTWR